MEMIFCPNCGKLTGYKRALGFGTFFAVLLTAGIWLLAIPFYPKRCITCGMRKSDSVLWYRTWRAVAAGIMLLAGGVLAVLVVAHFNGHAPKVSSLKLLGIREGSTDAAVHATAIGFRLRVCEDKGDDFKYCHYVRDQDETLLLIFWRDELETVEYDFGLKHYDDLFKELSAKCGSPRQGVDPKDGYYWGNYTEGAILSLTGDNQTGGSAMLNFNGGKFAEYKKTAYPTQPPKKWPEIPSEALPAVKRAEHRLFGGKTDEVESFTLGLGGGSLQGTWAVEGGCKPHDCGDNNAMWTVDLSTGQAAGEMTDESEVVVYLGDYESGEKLPPVLQVEIEHEGPQAWPSPKRVRYVSQTQ